MMLVLAGMEWKYLLAGFGATLPFLAALLFMVAWRRQRMLVFLNPESDPQGAGFHINQSLIAVGTGGLTGRGYMEGMQKLFADRALREGLIHRGIIRAKSFSWDESARSHLALFDEVLQS